MKLKRSKRDDINKSNIMASKRNRVTSTDGILSLISSNKIPGIFYTKEEEEEMKQIRKQSNIKFPIQRKVITKKNQKSVRETPKKINGNRKKASSVPRQKKTQNKQNKTKVSRKDRVLTRNSKKTEKKQKIEKKEKPEKPEKQKKIEKPAKSVKTKISRKSKEISTVPQNNIISRPPLPFQDEKSEKYQNLKEKDQRIIAGEKNGWVAKKIKNFISYQNQESTSFKILQEHIGKVNNGRRIEEAVKEKKMIEQPKIVIKIEDD